MKLLTLSATNFRGIGSCGIDLRLDADLLLFYGPNAHGKTSLAEAIEWLFYGTTKRREQGDQFSRVEYSGSFANIHGGRPVEVSARVRLGTKDVLLTRRLNDDSEQSATLIDGERGDFSSLGFIAAPAVYPVVVQHSLQNFIHTKPKGRRDAMSEALGLQELALLKSALDGARRSFQSSPPADVISARRELISYAREFLHDPDLGQLSQRWTESPPRISRREDVSLIIHRIQSLTASTVEGVEELLSLLRRRRSELAKAVFNIDNISPRISFGQIQIDIESARTVEAEAYVSLSDMLTSLVSVGLVATTRVLLKFWQDGLDLPYANDICPLCEEDTFTSDKRERLARKLKENEAFLTSVKNARSAITADRDAADQVVGVILKMKPTSIDQRERDALTQLMAGQDTEVDSFFRRYDKKRDSYVELDSRRTTFLQAADRLSEMTEKPDLLPDAVRSLGLERLALLKAIDACIAASKDFDEGWPEFERLLSARIAHSSAITLIDALGKALKNRSYLSLLERYDNLLLTSKSLMQRVEATLQRKQDEILGLRGVEVVGIYDQLNKGTNVGFEAMEPGTDNLKLHATSFGKRMSAAANLSQCQLNCLGLAVWLMQATTPTSPFSFVVLDDPIQSMDDDHCEAFISSLIPFLLDEHRKQVLVLSHLRPVIDRLRNLNSSRVHRVYHFESYHIGGPTVVEQSEFQKRLAEIRGLADGNEDNRVLAVDRMRVLAENVIRAVHLKLTGRPVPIEFDNARPSALLKLYLAIPGTTQQEHAGLSDTIGFADPSHHSDASYTPPQKTNIQPHLDRLTNLIRKYGLI